MPTPDCLIASDACLTGLGATCGKQYLHAKFPAQYLDQTKWKIHYLEMIALLVALKTWSHEIKHIRFMVKCDNQAVVEVINNGNTKDRRLQTLLRELTYVCAINESETVATYITSSESRLPDLLSRWYLKDIYQRLFYELTDKEWKQVQVQKQYFNLNTSW